MWRERNAPQIARYRTQAYSQLAWILDGLSSERLSYKILILYQEKNKKRKSEWNPMKNKLLETWSKKEIYSSKYQKKTK